MKQLGILHTTFLLGIRTYEQCLRSSCDLPPPRNADLSPCSSTAGAIHYAKPSTDSTEKTEKLEI